MPRSSQMGRPAQTGRRPGAARGAVHHGCREPRSRVSSSGSGGSLHTVVDPERPHPQPSRWAISWVANHARSSSRVGVGGEVPVGVSAWAAATLRHGRRRPRRPGWGPPPAPARTTARRRRRRSAGARRRARAAARRSPAAAISAAYSQPSSSPSGHAGAQRVGDRVRAQRAVQPALGHERGPARWRSPARRRAHVIGDRLGGRLPGAGGLRRRLPAAPARRPAAGPATRCRPARRAPRSRTARAGRRRAAGRGRR